MPNSTIRLRQVEKRFRYWADRPTSIKSALIDMVRGKFRMGTREELTVLRNVSFEIQQGEFVGIMGRNGAGKSTLLKLIAGIYFPTTGTVQVDGPIAPLIELGAGFSGELSGYENIFLNAAILGFGRQATMQAVPKILEFAELGERIYMPVKNYSSGMLVRLGFSIATHLAAPILLIDEVLAVGDSAFQEKCLKKIKSLHSEGRTIILVTHNSDDVKKHCTRCIVISGHTKSYDGPSSEGVSSYLESSASPGSA